MQNRDTLTDLRSTLYYYENVAVPTDKEREQQIQQTAAKLKSILAAITDQINGDSGFVFAICDCAKQLRVAVDQQIEQLRTEVASVFDCPELQCFRVRHVSVVCFVCF